jgi:acyl-CoA dehydrogenase
MARRALAEAVDWARKRRMFGQTLADFQLTQARIGEMAALIDAGALLTYRAAWMRDLHGRQRTRAQRGRGDGQDDGHRKRPARDRHGAADARRAWREGRAKVESLYRDIRSLRIYEGATEVQQLIIGKPFCRVVP